MTLLHENLLRVSRREREAEVDRILTVRQARREVRAARAEARRAQAATAPTRDGRAAARSLETVPCGD